MSEIFCVFNHRIISRSNVRHERQFLEDKAGNRHPFLKDGRVIIETIDGLLHCRRTDGYTFAITNDMRTAIQRARKAERTAEIKAKRGDYLTDIDEQERRVIAPIVFRVTYYEGKYGFIAAIDAVIDGKETEPLVTYDAEELPSYVRQKAEGQLDYVIAYGRAGTIETLAGMGKDDEYLSGMGWSDFDHLRELVEQYRQQAERNSTNETI